MNAWGVPAFVAEPTAKQLVAAVHDTPPSVLPLLPLGFGLRTIDHVVPLKCSTSVFLAEPVRLSPAATQLVALVHDTSSSSAADEPGTPGPALIDHFVPFQRSARVVVSTEPTATQLVLAAHDAPSRYS